MIDDRVLKSHHPLPVGRSSIFGMLREEGVDCEKTKLLMTGCFLQRREGVHVQETEKWLRFVLRNVVALRSRCSSQEFMQILFQWLILFAYKMFDYWTRKRSARGNGTFGGRGIRGWRWFLCDEWEVLRSDWSMMMVWKLESRTCSIKEPGKWKLSDGVQHVYSIRICTRLMVLFSIRTKIFL